MTGCTDGNGPGAKRGRGRLLRPLTCAILAAVLAGGLAVATYFLLPGYKVWDSPGAMVVLASRDEAWIFLEIERVVYRPLTAEHPTLALGRSLEVLVLDRDGLKSQFSQPGTEVRTHPNLGVIWRGKDSFCVRGYGSRSSPSKAWCWVNNGFAPASVAVTEDGEWQEVARAVLGDQQDVANVISSRHGWKLLCAEPDLVSKPYVRWQGAGYELVWYEQGNGTITLDLVVEKPEGTVVRTQRVVFPSPYHWLPRRMSSSEYRAMGGV